MLSSLIINKINCIIFYTINNEIKFLYNITEKMLNFIAEITHWQFELFKRMYKITNKKSIF